MTFPYSFDQVVDAIASTRGDGAHFVLTMFLQRHAEEVGVDRFRRLLETAKLRGQDQMSIHLTLAQVDASYASQLPRILRSARSGNAQQVLLASLPDVLPRKRNDAVADELESWIRQRVARLSYWENGALWEIPSVVLGVFYAAGPARARVLLADLESEWSERGRPFARRARESDDEGFEQALNQWRDLDSSHPEGPPTKDDETGRAEVDAELERDAIRYMRRLGFTPAG